MKFSLLTITFQSQTNSEIFHLDRKYYPVPDHNSLMKPSFKFITYPIQRKSDKVSTLSLLISTKGIQGLDPSQGKSVHCTAAFLPVTVYSNLTKSSKVKGEREQCLAQILDKILSRKAKYESICLTC